MPILPYRGDHAGSLPPHKRRPLLKRYAVALVAVTALVAGIILQRWPWLPYGSWDRYVVRRYGSAESYWKSEVLRYVGDPDQAVYEEEPQAAAALLGLLSGDDEGGIYLNLRSTGDSPCAAFEPTPFYKLFGSLPGRFGVLFMHSRSAKSRTQRRVIVRCHQNFALGPHPSHKNGALLIASAVTPDDAQLGMRSFSAGRLEFPEHDSYWRLYAGQPDPADDSHFTIKYEIDHVPGTIDGWLQPDDTVKLQIRDGPALTAAASQPSSPPSP